MKVSILYLVPTFLLLCSGVACLDFFTPYDFVSNFVSGGCSNLELSVDISYCGYKTKNISIYKNGRLELYQGTGGCHAKLREDSNHHLFTIRTLYHEAILSEGPGTVHYLVSKEPAHINKTINSIMKLGNVNNFNPEEILIVTHTNIHSKFLAKGNTYQVVLASSGSASYLILIYKDVQWVENGSTPATIAYECDSSEVSNVKDFVNGSNIGDPGVYIFDITSTSAKSVTTSLSKLYPFGSSVGDRSSGENSIKFTFPFNQLIFRSVSVCSSGYVTFEPQDCYESCVATRSVIAPFWLGDANDLWKEVTTDVFYRVSYDETMLATVQNDIQGCIGDKIEPVKVLVATWIHSRNAKKNMFQMALATDGKSSYAVYKYPKLEYSSVTDEWGETTYARALMVSHSCAASRLPETEVSAKQSASILDLQHQTNCKRADLEGVFVYRVDSDLPFLQGHEPKHLEKESINYFCKSARTQLYDRMYLCAEAGPSYYEPAGTQTGNRYGYARDGYHSYYERPYGYAGYADDRGREGYNPYEYNPYGARVNYYPQSRFPSRKAAWSY